MKHVNINDFPRVLGEDMGRLHRKLVATAYLAAMANVKLVTAHSPVDTGFYKNSHQVRKTNQGGVLYNAAPYAATLEAGARPHGISPDGMKNLVLWVWRKIRPESEKVAVSIAYAIAKKIATVGQAPLWIYKNNLQAMSTNMQSMMDRTLRAWQP